MLCIKFGRSSETDFPLPILARCLFLAILTPRNILYAQHERQFTMPLRGLIFDLDGVITDTAEYHYQSWKQLAEEEGLPFTRQDNDALRGVSRRKSLIFLLKGKTLPETTMQDYMKRKNDYYQDLMQQITPADTLTGVTDFLAQAHADGMKLGIGSASRNARPVLERLELLTMFDAVGDGYSVANPKPAPDLFVWVAGGMRVPVADVVVFEDAEAGVDAALAAGCLCVGIGNANVKHAHLVLPDGFASTTYAELMPRLNALRSG
jgi:beta-phosphoglucomutase